MIVSINAQSPPCAHVPEVYQDELLHSPPERTDISAAAWDELAAKRASAHRQCAGCPLMVACLYRAVVEVDVSGFVACTTESDRLRIRAQLGIEVQQLSSTPFGVPRVGGGPLSHDAVMAARESHPKDTCHQLADRLGCSTSTIKRHLRRARDAKLAGSAAPNHTSRTAPSVDAVLDCFDELESSQIA